MGRLLLLGFAAIMPVAVKTGIGCGERSMDNLQLALDEWSECLGEANVRADDASRDHYARSTQPTGTRPAAILQPASQAEVSAAVRVAARHRIALYPISRGKNWGYGDACAITDGQ